ncbi:hypothetical protein OG885_10010 [Streptomyces sp. NBC_00028]
MRNLKRSTSTAVIVATLIELGWSGDGPGCRKLLLFSASPHV